MPRPQLDTRCARRVDRRAQVAAINDPNSSAPVTKCQWFFNHFFKMGKKIEHIDFSIHSTSSFNNIFEFDKSEFAVIYADDGISGTNTKNVRTLTV